MMKADLTETIMRTCSTLLLLTITELALAETSGLRVSSDAPGNLFIEGEQIQFTADPDKLDYRLIDYQGEDIRSGQAKDRRIALGPLPCGYYELTCSVGQQTVTVPFGVIAKPKPTATARIAVDGATAWLCKPDQWPVVAKMLRRAGITWVRERFTWSEVQPKEGMDFQWGKYDTVATLLADQKVNVYQIFHDTPAWTHPSEGKTRNPDDLRTVYRFAKAAGRHFAGRIQAWEVWNEADIEFWPDLADRFAGLQKAAYLGFKAGAPDVKVLLVSLCQGPTNFSRNLFACGVADYYDIFNFHIYNSPANYPKTAADYLNLLNQHQVAGRPAWLTEAGIRLLGDKNGDLSKKDLTRQAEFIPTSLVMSLASGVDRHFVFVLPWYLENGVQFGLLRRDLTPHPAMIALAVAANSLGEANYLGRLPSLPPGVEARLFNTGEATVAAVWAEKTESLDLPVGSEEVQLVGLMGDRKQLKATHGRLRLEVGRATQYVVGLRAPTGLTEQARQRGTTPPAIAPCRVVSRGYARNLPVDKRNDAYILNSTNPFDYEVELCNLDEAAAHEASLEFELPGSWLAQPSAWSGRLEPMARQIVPVKIRPGRSRLERQTVRLAVQVDAKPAARSISTFSFDLASLKPADSMSLWSGDVGRWVTNISPNGTMEIASPLPSMLRFTIRFARPGDRWAYPFLKFSPFLDLSAWQGVAFEYRCDLEDTGTQVRVQIVEPSGSAYISEPDLRAGLQWRRVVIPFTAFQHGRWSPEDSNHRFDTQQIAQLMVGCNTSRDGLTLELRHLQAVRFEGPYP